MAAARLNGEEDGIGRRRSYAVETHELARYRSQYSDASAAHHRTSSRARSQKSLGPPHGLARVPFELKKFWGRQISVVVDQVYNRDHLGTESLYSPAFFQCLVVCLGSVSGGSTHAGVYLSAAGIRISRRFILFIVQGAGLDGGEATSAG